MTRDIYGLGDFNTDQIKELAKLVEDDGMDASPIYLRRPDAAPDPKAAVKQMPLDQVPLIIPDALTAPKGIDAATALSLPQLEKIGNEGDQYLKEAIKMALALALKEQPNNANFKDSQEYINQSPAWQV